MNSRWTILTVPNHHFDHFDCSKWPERFVAKDSDAQCFCQNKLAVLVETLWFPTWIRDSWLLQIRANGPIFPNKIEHNPHCFQMSVLDTKDRSFLVPSSLSLSLSLHPYCIYLYIYMQMYVHANVSTCKCIYYTYIWNGRPLNFNLCLTSSGFKIKLNSKETNITRKDQCVLSFSLCIKSTAMIVEERTNAAL